MTKKYPREFNDRELKEKIDEYADTAINGADSVPYFTKASLGLVELQGRQNKRVALLALIISGVSLVVVTWTAFNK